MNIKTNMLFLTFFCLVNSLKGSLMDDAGVNAAIKFNTGMEENINLATSQGSTLIDRAAEAVGTQGNQLVDRAAAATLEQGSALIEKSGLAASEHGNILIDKAAKETRETAESVITTAADKAYKVGYDTGYGTVTGVCAALKDGALAAAPYLVASGLLIGGCYLLYCYRHPYTPTNQELMSHARASHHIAKLERATNSIHSELSLIECFNDCVFGKRNQTGIPAACETQFHTYAQLAGSTQAAQKATIFRESCPTTLE